MNHQITSGNHQGSHMSETSDVNRLKKLNIVLCVEIT